MGYVLTVSNEDIVKNYKDSASLNSVCYTNHCSNYPEYWIEFMILNGKKTTTIQLCEACYDEIMSLRENSKMPAN